MAKSSVVSVEEKKPAAQQPAVSNPAPRQTGSTVVSKKLYDRNPATTANIPSMQNTGSNVVTTRQPRVPVTQVMNTGLKKSFDVELKQPDVKWYSGEQPTIREAYQRLAVIHKTDPNRAAEAYGLLQSMKKDPTSSFYSPYEQPTNRAVSELAKYGIDTSKIDDDFFRRNEWLKQYYDPSNYTNNPSAPTKKSSNLERAAYWYYQLELAREDTDAADQEWADLQKEIAYLASSDMNLSDKQIADRINKEIVSGGKYKTLAKMDDGRQRGAPVELNRATGYSQDAIYGAIWAARNGGSTGDSEQDLMNYVRFVGNRWVDNPEISAKLNIGDLNTYSPYSVGMANMDEEGSYFGRRFFDQNWIDENRARYLGSGDATAVKMFNNVQAAEKYTQKLEAELEALYTKIDQQLQYYGESDTGAETIIKLIQDNKDFKDLFDLDETLTTGVLNKTTRKVDYRWKDVEEYIRGKCKGIRDAKSPVDVVDEAQTVSESSVNPSGEPAAEESKPLGTVSLIGRLAVAGLGMSFQYIKNLLGVGNEKAAESSSAPTNITGPVNTPAPGDTGSDFAGDVIGRYGKGNIDLLKRPVFKQEDGSISTVNSISFYDPKEDKEILIPTIVNGQQVSDNEAINHYYDTKEYLGKFNTPEEANEYAELLHAQQERIYGQQSVPTVPAGTPASTPGAVNTPAVPSPTVTPVTVSPAPSAGSVAPVSGPVNTPAAGSRPEISVPSPSGTPAAVTAAAPAGAAAPASTTAQVPVITPSPSVLDYAQKMLEEQVIANMEGMASTIESKGTAPEASAFLTSKTSYFGQFVDNLINSVRDGIEWLTASNQKNIVTSYLDRTETVYNYESHQKQLESIESQLADIEGEWQSLKDRQDTMEHLSGLTAEDLDALQNLTTNPPQDDMYWDEMTDILRNQEEEPQERIDWALGELYSRVTGMSVADYNGQEALSELSRAEGWWDYLQGENQQESPIDEMIRNNADNDTDFIEEEIPVPNTNGTNMRITLEKDDNGQFRFYQAENTVTGETYGAEQKAEVDQILGFQALNPLTEEEATRFDELTRLKDYLTEQQQTEQKFLDEEEGSYQRAKTDRDQLMESYVTAALLGEMTGKSFDISILSDMDYAFAAGRDDSIPQYLTNNVLDLQVAEGNLSRDDATIMAQAMAVDNLQSVAKLQAVLDTMNRMGVTMPDDWLANIQRKMDYLREDAVSSSYVLLDGVAGFKEGAEAGRKKAESGKSGRLAKAIATGTYGFEWGDLLNGLTVSSAAMANKKKEVIQETINVMTDEEKNRYFYLLNKNEKEAEAYLNMLTNEERGVLVARRSQDVQNQMRDYASQNFWTASAATGLSFVTNMFGGAEALIYETGQKLAGKNINVYNPMFDNMLSTGSLRGGVKDQINNVFGGEDKLGAVIGNLIYDGFTSSVDSWLNAQMMDGVFSTAASFFDGTRTANFFKAVNAAIQSSDSTVARVGQFVIKAGSDLAHASTMGLNSAAATYRDVIAKHGSEDQAIRMAVATFFAETGSEAITVGNIHEAFGKGQEAARDGLKGLLVEFFKNGAEEALGEGVNEWVSQNADRFIMGALSEYEQTVQELIGQGIPEDAAYQMADSAMWKTILRSAATGFVSSGFSTTASYVSGKRNKSRAIGTPATVPNVNDNVEENQQVEPQNGAAVTSGDVSNETNPETETDERPIIERHQVGDKIYEVHEGETLKWNPLTGEPKVVPVQQQVDPILQRQDADTAARVDAEKKKAEEAVQSFAKDKAILSSLLSGSRPTTAAVGITAVLGGKNALGSREATQALIGEMAQNDPKLAVQTMNAILMAAHGDTRVVKQSIIESALTEGNGHDVLSDIMDSVAHGEPVTVEDVNGLQDALQYDKTSNPETFAQNLKAGIKNRRVATATVESFQNGEGKKRVKAAEKAADKAKESVDTAAKTLERAQADVKSAAETLSTAVSEQMKDAGNTALSAPVEQATEQLEAAVQNQEVQQEAVEAAQSNLEEAQQEVDAVQTEEMSNARAEAVTTVDQQMQEEAEQAAQQAEQDFQDALASYPPTKAFSQPVTATLVNGGEVQLTGVFGYTDGDVTVYTTTQGYITDNEIDNYSEGFDALYDAATNSWHNGDTPVNPVAWMDHSLKATRVDTGEVVDLIGFTGQQDGFDPVVMDSNGNVYTSDQITMEPDPFTGTSGNLALFEAFEKAGGENLPDVSNADLYQMANPEAPSMPEGAMPYPGGPVEITESDGTTHKVIGMKIVNEQDVQFVNEDGTLIPYDILGTTLPLDFNNWVTDQIIDYVTGSSEEDSQNPTEQDESGFGAINGVSFLKSPTEAKMVATDGDEYSLVGLTVSFGGDVLAVDSDGQLIPLSWAAQIDPAFAQWAVENVDQLKEDNFDHGISMTADVAGTESVKSFMQGFMTSAESTATPVFDTIDGTGFLKAPNTATLKTGAGDYDVVGITVWLNGKPVFVDGDGVPLPMHWVQQSNDPGFIQWALNNLSVLKEDNSANGIDKKLNQDQIDYYKNMLSQVLNQSSGGSGGTTQNPPSFEPIGSSKGLKAPNPVTITFDYGNTVKAVGITVNPLGYFNLIDEDGNSIALLGVQSIDNPEFFQWAIDNLDILKEDHSGLGVPALAPSNYASTVSLLEHIKGQPVSTQNASNPPVSTTSVDEYSEGKKNPKTGAPLKNWQNPKYHGDEVPAKRASVKTKAFKNWFFGNTAPEAIPYLTKADGTPRPFFRGYGGGMGSTMYMVHAGNQVATSAEGTPMYKTFYMSTISTASSYAGGIRYPVLLRNIKNWETAKAAMQDIGYDLVEAPNPNGSGEMGYQVMYKHSNGALTPATGKQPTWFAESQLKKFKYTYGGNLKHEGIFVGYIGQLKSPMILDGNGSNWTAIYAGPNGITAPDGDVRTGTHSTDSWATWAFKHGFDSIIFDNIMDNISGGGEVGTEIITSQPEQFKSAYNSGTWKGPNIMMKQAGLNTPGQKVTLAQLMGKDDVSHEFKSVQERLNNDEHVDVEEVLALPEFVWAAKNRTPGFSITQSQMNAIRKAGQGITTPEAVRSALPKKIADRIMRVKALLDKQGSAVFDSEGKVSYTGKVEQGKRLDLLIGLPASGKSTIADYLSAVYHSMLGDSDVAKELTLKDMGKVGRVDEDFVHNEGKLSNDMRLAEAAARGDNVLFSVIGNDVKSLYARIAPFQDNGYEIHVHYTDLPQNKALGRMLGRMAKTSRVLDYASVAGINPQDIMSTFEALKGDATIAETVRWNTDVAENEKPIPVDYSGSDPSELFSGRISDMATNLAQGSTVNGIGTPGGSNNGSGYSGLNTEDLKQQNRTRTEQHAEDTKAKLKSPQDIAQKLVKRLGFGNYMGSNNFGRVKGVLGFWDTHAKYVAVKAKELGNYTTTMHETGHGIADKLGITGTADMVNKLVQINPDFANAYDPSQLPGEAMAEFFWRYLESEERARDFAGDTFYDDFERRLLANPDMYDAVQEARQELQQWIASDADARAAAIIKHDRNGERGSWMKRFRETIQDIAEFIQKGVIDQSSAAAEINNFARKALGVKDLDLAYDVRANALMANHSQKQATAILTDNLTDSSHTIIGDGLAKRLSDVGFKGTDQDIKDLEVYTLALHALDRDEQRKTVFGENFTKADLQAIINKYKSTRPDIVAAEEVWQNFRKEFLQAWMVDTGYWTQEFFDHLNEMYPHYMPTYRVKGGKEGLGARFGGAKSKKYTLHEATGSSENIYSPFYSFIGMVDQIVSALDFDRLYQENPGMGVWARQIFDEGPEGFVPENNGEMNARQQQLFDMLNGQISGDLMEQVLDVVKGQPGVKNSKDPGLLRVQRPDGTVVRYQVDDPYLYNLLAGVQSSAGIQGLQILGKLTRTMSMLTTGSNPLFAARNAVRDYQASVNYGSWASNYLSGIPKWLKTFVDVWRGDATDAEYRALGGGGWTRIDQNNSKSMNEMREAMFGEDKSSVGKTAKWLGKKLWNTVTLERLNEVIEQTSRQVEYRYGKHDRSTAEGRQRAFQAAQDVTVDFSRRGNSGLASVLQKLVPFFNASTQGVYRTGRQFTEEERGRVGARFAKTVINTALASALSSALIMKFSDDDDKDEFRNMLSSGIKANHLIIPNPLKGDGQPPFLRIPLEQNPLGYLVHGAVTNAIWNGTDDADAISLMAIADVIVDNLNPLGSGSILQPMVDASHNKTWYGGNIVRSYMLDWTDKPSQYNEDTPYVFRALGRLFNESPEVVEYLATQYSGFIGATMIPALTYDDNGNVGGVDALLQSVIKKWTADPLSSNDVTKYFYNAANSLSTIKDEASSDRPQGLLASNLSQEQVDSAYMEADEMLKSNGIIGATKKLISDAYKRIDEINANDTLTDAEKYEQTSNVKREMLKRVRVANQQLQAYETKYMKGGSLIDNMFSLIHGGKLAHIPTDEERLPQVFKDDASSNDPAASYMRFSQEVYNATGNANVLPHPTQNITIKDVDYTISDEEWDRYVQIYRDAYMQKVYDKWDASLSDDQKKKIFSGSGSAHSAGMAAIRQAYAIDHGIE